MPLQNKISPEEKNRIAYLAAHSLFLTYTEALLPRFVPFFRLGLGNTVILLALNLNLNSFLLLVLIKTVTACMMNGTLFSPFFLISIAQSFGSGLLMYGINKIKKNWISIYGISLCGASFSSVIQIILCSLYLKTGVFKFLGPMLIFSIFSGILTAVLSQSLKIEDTPPVICEKETSEKTSSRKKILFMITSIIISSALIFIIKNIFILTGFLIVSFSAQLLCGRKIKLIPHITMWIFIVLSSLFIPEGRVLYSLGKFSITNGALLSGISKSLKLSSVMALSQCMSSIKIKGNSLLACTIRYFSFIKENQISDGLRKKISIKNKS